MRVFLAGGSGAVGGRLVPALVAAGHRVTATTTRPAKLERLRALGAEPVVLDALDRAAVVEAVRRAAPEVVVHELTAIPSAFDLRHFDRAFALTNRLRTEGLDHLLEGARAAGARRFLAQSFTGTPFAKVGGPVKREEDPFDPDPAPAFRATQQAIEYLERKIVEATDLEALALRYGFFYGPGTSIAPGGSTFEAVKARKLPLVGDGGGVWSFVHIDDVAAATTAAVAHGAPGVYQVTDDEPAPVREWLPTLAAAIGAPPPRHVPAWLARLLVGRLGVEMMTTLRGAANAKAKRELGWTPLHPTWRTGFRTLLTAS
jgi:nucleoside-diphosphate-sugar epimerase